MSSTVEQIKDRLSIVDVVSSYLKLEKAGKNFKARCPFHTEKTPSFFVSPDRDSFHCFGCDKGGDMFTFIEEIEGVDFKEALEILADRAGVRIVRVGSEEASERAKLLQILEEATKFYEAILTQHEGAQKYLESRGITAETIKRFRIGFAPELWRSAGEALMKKGFGDALLERAGLIIRADSGRWYDRFLFQSKRRARE